MFDLDVVSGILEDFSNQDMFQLLRECMSVNVDIDVNHNPNTKTNAEHNDNHGMRREKTRGNRTTIHKVIAARNAAWTRDILNELKQIQLQAAYTDNDDGGDGGGLKLSTLDAGHWVHVDDLDGLLKIMSKEF